MSKKKSTMTLKDFHGGSIPSDIPLPSAPGVMARPLDRSGYDRQSAWGNPTPRSDHRLRPNSSGSIRNLDDKTPFLSTNPHIGRNFDEDERKPLDGPSGPRRTVSDESIHAPVIRSEPKSSVPPQVGVVGSSSSSSSYSARVVEGGHSVVSSRPSSGGGGGGYPNAWGVKKESVVGVGLGSGSGLGSSPWCGQSTVTKFAQASALDQISSGRWQTKPTHHQADVEVIRQSESPNSLYGRAKDSYSGVNFVDEREYYENSLVGHVERGLAVEDGIRGMVEEMPGVERVRSPVLQDGNERNSALYANAGEPAYRDSKSRGSEVQIPPEVSERPKLKLLPRTKPLDVTDAFAVDHKQLVDTSHLGGGGNINGNASVVKPGLTSNETSHVKSGLTSYDTSRVQPAPSNSEAGNRLVERPKLNFKPRSQSLDQSGNTERERLVLFGGARPREMVLKERGVDDVVKNHEYDDVQAPSRIKSDVRPEIAPVPANNLPNNSRHGERMENLPIDHRTGRGNERREPRGDVQKADVQRKNRRNENWRNSRDTEKHQQQERQPSPETWRKPVDQPKPANSAGSGLRFGKAVSAVELAQAFSRPVSDPKPADQFSGQRGRPARTQVPFSRLTGPATRSQINGY